VKHVVIHIKVPCLSNIFDKVRFTSILSNSQSDHISLVDASINNIIMHNVERSIEGDNLLVSNKMRSDCISQYTMKIRKVDGSNILTFKFSPSFTMGLVWYMGTTSIILCTLSLLECSSKKATTTCEKPF
jgi:hypothetical protein